MIHTLSAEAAGSYEQIRSAIHADNHTVSIPANLEKEKKKQKKNQQQKAHFSIHLQNSEMGIKRQLPPPHS